MCPSESIRQAREAWQASNHRLQILDLILVASGSGAQRSIRPESPTEWKDYLGTEQGASHSVLAQP